MDKYFSGKIRCTVPSAYFTENGIYEVKDGELFDDAGDLEVTDTKTIEDINNYFSSKFELVEEPKYFNGKIRCIKAKTDSYTLNNIYTVKNGSFSDNYGNGKGLIFDSLSAINKMLLSKFELVEEPDFKSISDTAKQAGDSLAKSFNPKKSLEHIENVIQEFSHLEEKTNKQKLQEIISYFGEDNQKLKAIEELSELTIAILNAKNDKTENLIEEIADVEIMLKQLKLIYKIDKSEIKKAKEFKINRTLKMIEEA